MPSAREDWIFLPACIAEPDRADCEVRSVRAGVGVDKCAGRCGDGQLSHVLSGLIDVRLTVSHEAPWVECGNGPPLLLIAGSALAEPERDARGGRAGFVCRHAARRVDFEVGV